jgi:glycosyltransferase involved in cell wall biosynthesis
MNTALWPSRANQNPAVSEGRSALAAERLVVVVCSHAPSLWNFRTELIRELVRREYRVLACGPAHKEAAARLASIGAAFIELGPERTSVNPLDDFRYFWRLLRFFLRARPFAIISYTAKPVIWGSIAASIARIPKVVALITGLGFAFTDPERERSLVSCVVRYLYRAAIRRCDVVAFQNKDDRSEFVDRGLLHPPTSAFVVNGSGVNLHAFAPVGLPEEPVFLLIARLLRDKGVREFCAAAAQIKARFPEARFRIVGWFDRNPSAITASELEEWCGNGVVEYRGEVSDVRPEIAAARVYVLPSYREGTPRTVLEAMSMGRPIITTDVPGCRETVREGWNGYLVPARDVEALAVAMEEFVVHPATAANMGANSRAFAEAKYDAQKVAESLLLGAGL